MERIDILRHSKKRKFCVSRFNRALKAFENGHTTAGAAEAAGVSLRTLYRWLADDPVLREHVKEAKFRADDQVVKALKNTALEGNVTAMIFWLKNRRPDQWRDRHDHQVNVDRTERVEFVAVFADGSEVEQPIKVESDQAGPPSPPALPN